jgi:hypothetical protein
LTDAGGGKGQWITYVSEPLGNPNFVPATPFEIQSESENQKETGYTVAEEQVHELGPALPKNVRIGKGLEEK